MNEQNEINCSVIVTLSYYIFILVRRLGNAKQSNANLESSYRCGGEANKSMMRPVIKLINLINLISQVMGTMHVRFLRLSLGLPLLLSTLLSSSS